MKPNPPPNLSCRCFTHATETIIWAARDKKSRYTFNYKLMKDLAGGKQMKSVWQIPALGQDEKRFGKHPAQKPLALLERILLAASNKGDLVLDPFLGSGTTAVAALRLGRAVLAVEQEQLSVDLAVARVFGEILHVRVLVDSFHIGLDLRGALVDRSSGRPRGRGMAPLSRIVYRDVTAT